MRHCPDALCPSPLPSCHVLSVQALVCATAMTVVEGGVHRVKWMRGSELAAPVTSGEASSAADVSSTASISASATASVTAAYTPVGIINHGGYIMNQPCTINFIWVGTFSEAQKSLTRKFITSLPPSSDPGNTGKEASPSTPRL